MSNCKIEQLPNEEPRAEEGPPPPREGGDARALAAVGVQVARDELDEELLRRMRVRAGGLPAGRHDLVEGRDAGRAVLLGAWQPMTTLCSCSGMAANDMSSYNLPLRWHNQQQGSPNKWHAMGEDSQRLLGRRHQRLQQQFCKCASQEQMVASSQ